MTQTPFDPDDTPDDAAYAAYLEEQMRETFVTRIFDRIARRAHRTAGTYNRADPTAWVTWELGHLALRDVTWGIAVEWRGRRLAYDPRLAQWAMAHLERAHDRAHAGEYADPMGRLSDWE